MIAENNNLANENKQLGALVKEYEQTLEGVMSSFRVRAVCMRPSWASMMSNAVVERSPTT